MVGSLLVAVVEAVELRDQEPPGHCGEEEKRLGRGVERAVSSSGAKNELRNQERNNQSERIGESQCSVHKPAAADRKAAPASISNDLICPLGRIRCSLQRLQSGVRRSGVSRIHLPQSIPRTLSAHGEVVSEPQVRAHVNSPSSPTLLARIQSPVCIDEEPGGAFLLAVPQ